MVPAAWWIVFDCEELLEQSIRSIRDVASFVCVVYQVISNFGAPYVLHTSNEWLSMSMSVSMSMSMPTCLCDGHVLEQTKALYTCSINYIAKA
jgi:hypothetical protein